MLKIASWNVNSIKARLVNVLEWVDAAEPDVLLLQEIKTVAETFPHLEFETRGYRALVVGQKSYNGVAILSRAGLDDPLTCLPGEPEDEQARYAEASVRGVRVASIYLPNGNPVDSEKYPYKLRWMARLRERAAHLLASEQAFVLGGDFNVIPAPQDVYDPEGWADDALFRLETRKAFRALLNLGLTDAYRAVHPVERGYTYWDYQGMAWAGDRGLRIDHLLLSPQAADRLEGCEIDKEPRGRSKASDHTPIWCTLREEADS